MEIRGWRLEGRGWISNFQHPTSNIRIIALALTVALFCGCAVATPSPTPTSTRAATATSTQTMTPTPTRTTTSTPRPTATPTPTNTATPTPTPPPTSLPLPPPQSWGGERGSIGQSVEGRPIEAQRFGEGRYKVVLVGDIHGGWEANTYELAQKLLAHFRANPDDVPSNVSLWIIPTLNPDGLAAGTRFNAQGVDLNRNCDTDLDGCAGNDWSPTTYTSDGPQPGAGGAYPFSEPEARAARDFLADAHVAVFYHSFASAVFAGGCRDNAPSLRLAAMLAVGTGYDLPEEGWTGYPVSGSFTDYLTDLGIAAAIVELTDFEDTEFDRNLEGVRAVLAAVEDIVTARFEDAPGEAYWLDQDNVTTYRYPTGTFPHPVSLAVASPPEPALVGGVSDTDSKVEGLEGTEGEHGDTLYLVDSGRLLRLTLASPPKLGGIEGGHEPPVVMAAPGDTLAGLPVQELSDVALSPDDSLLLLDRSGEVFRYDVTKSLVPSPLSLVPSTETWHRVDWEAIAGTGGTYVTAIAADKDATYFLDTNGGRVWRVSGGRAVVVAEFQSSRGVDLAVDGENLYVLLREWPAEVVHYHAPGWKKAWSVSSGLDYPSALCAIADGLLYVLDSNDRRVLALDAETGEIRATYTFIDREVTLRGCWPVEDGLLLIGPDVLFQFPISNLQPPASNLQPPASNLQPPASNFQPPISNLQPPASNLQPPASNFQPPISNLQLDRLRGLTMPIAGMKLPQRLNSLPGAPRHYRYGVHQGIDFYAWPNGTKVTASTEVLAARDGIVIRADGDYVNPTQAQMNDWLATCRREGYTPEDVLDSLRGRQVWLDHGDGLITRYAHLAAVAPGLKVGHRVAQGQVIGKAGNSGTPGSLYDPNSEIHLHFEIWLDGRYVGQYLSTVEIRRLLSKVLR
ncbi:MAG: hypothetical protein FJ014_00110 [Chloroflexi bacterium]|nr:hypothetical protein [Chloroflexota bacterium]